MKMEKIDFFLIFYMLSIGCAESLEMGVSEREKSKVTSEFLAWLDGGAMKNEAEIVGQGEGRKCITQPFKLDISISQLIKDAKFLVEWKVWFR